MKVYLIGAKDFHDGFIMSRYNGRDPVVYFNKEDAELELEQRQAVDFEPYMMEFETVDEPQDEV
jgi:hypothetical protein